MSGSEISNTAIAVVGMAGRFPGARNIAEYWQNLRDGVESIQTFSDRDLKVAGVSPELLRDPNYVKTGVALDNLEMFDASFFGFSPKDAAIMDPQHRHFLECAWEALEHAGHTPENFKGSIGVYAGSGMNAYMIYNLLTNRKLVESAGLFLLRQTGNDKDVLATRVSYQLNLRGPSINIQTACSTSLVAIHMACQSLLNHECDMALAGGVTIEIPHRVGYVYREGEILSEDGHCRSFDAKSTGTVFGSGLGIVVLRRLRDAIEDGDTIHAIVRGSAINNDGSRKVGYLAPSVEGQAEVIAEALAVADVDAESISYIETHGTGTKVGDPIEVAGLTQAFRESTERSGYCAIGSVKTNIGHLDAAAGVAGFIKTVLALEHGQIPPSLHFEKPNPHIDFASSPFYVNSRLQDWKSGDQPLRAGVTSLGIGGTNAHVILEAAPPVARPRDNRPWQLLTVSAKSPAALDAASENLARHIELHPDLDLADVSFTCQLGRKAFGHRRAVVAKNAQEAAAALRDQGAEEANDREIVFLFSGQGAQYVNMGLDLYRGEAEFREQIDRCSEQLLPHVGLDLRSILYPPEDRLESARQQLSQTGLTQPALFVVEYALAKLWQSWGIRPQAMLGHSIGEYVAACLAGVFSLEAALEIVAARGRLMQSLPAGAMTAVPLAEQDVLPLLSSEATLAVVNGPRQCVVSGTTGAIEKLEQDLSRRDVACRRLHTSHAFHSPMMDPILGPFTEVVRQFVLHAPKVPYLSNLTGTWITPAQAQDPEYWSKHLRGTVQFSKALGELYREPPGILLEVGPGQTLSALARVDPRRPREQRTLASMRSVNQQSPDLQVLLAALGQLWSSGTRVDWEAFRARDRGYRTPLPSYPFERKRYWIEPGDHAFGVSHDAPPSERKRPEIAQWFYRPEWKKEPLSKRAGVASQEWLLFSDGRLGPLVAELLRDAGIEVTIVAAGTRYAAGKREYTIRPSHKGDYAALIADLVERKKAPAGIVHLWPLNHSPNHSLEIFYSLLFLAQALGEHELTNLQLAIVSDRMQKVAGDTLVHPESATLLGPCKTIPKEYPGIICRSIDIALSGQNGSPPARKLYVSSAQQVTDEILVGSADLVTAYRGEDRWIQTFEPVTIEADPSRSRLRDRGVYLITGGLGGIGLTIAERLSRQVHARLVLIGRTGALGSKIRKIEEMEQAGAEVLVVQADVTNQQEMRAAIAQARERFGAIHGVIHAAGVLDDGLIQLKTRDRAQAVLEPKIRGTLVLDELLKDADLDFLVLFSSISSIAPPAGQVDYAAANAFLDAFASSQPSDSAHLTVAINWGLWREVGMGAQGLDSAGSTVYSKQLNSRTDWVLDQHRFRGGKALLPGTAYIAMAVDALTANAKERPVELRDVVFVAPLALGDDETKEMQVRFEGERFSVASGQEYASGTGSLTCFEPPHTLDPRQILARCKVREIDFRGRKTKQEKYFDFGPRWRSLQRIHVGEGEAVSVLELPAEFHGDLAEHRIHPALFDIATGSALYLIRDYESSEALYLPLSYRKLTVWGRLPARIYSHIRVTGDNTGSREVATFDITILDESGAAVIDIEGFTMRRIADPRVLTADAGPRTPAEIQLAQRREEGILPSEGVEAFLRILSSTNAGPTVVVTPRDLRAVLAATGESPQRKPSRAVSESRKGAPRDEIERTLAGWWEELLGAEQVGVGEDFFELGGHSLIAVRLFTKIKKAFQLDLGLATLFEARTIGALAAIIRKESKQEVSAPRRWSPLVSIQPSGSNPPFYFVSGAGGNVLNFETLAKHLGADQPVYALQPQGLDGKQPFLTSVEEMASYYLREIKTIQPEGPYFLAGYSFGGFVTFEMAQQLRAQGEQVGLLVLLDTIEWHYWERVKHSLRLRDKFELYKARLKHVFVEPDGMDYLTKRLRTKGSRILFALWKAAGRPLPQSAGTIEDANWFALSNYQPRIYPGRVTLIRCSERHLLDGDDYQLGWGDLAEGVDVHEAPGHHLNITKEPNVHALAEILRQCIREAQAKTVVAAR